jgi:hypothetical protein
MSTNRISISARRAASMASASTSTPQRTTGTSPFPRTLFQTKLDACGSASMIALLRPDRRAITARLVATVDFPLPPLPTQATVAGRMTFLLVMAPGGGEG